MGLKELITLIALHWNLLRSPSPSPSACTGRMSTCLPILRLLCYTLSSSLVASGGHLPILDANPDLTFHFNADADPDPDLLLNKVIKIGDHWSSDYLGLLFWAYVPLLSASTVLHGSIFSLKNSLILSLMRDRIQLPKIMRIHAYPQP